MRTHLTLGQRHDSPTLEIVAGPEVPPAEQIAGFKRAAAARENPQFRSLQLWVSDAGCIREARFHPAAPAPDPEQPPKKPKASK